VLKEKVDYINQQGFAGAIVWGISGDTPDHELEVIVKEIKTTPGTRSRSERNHGQSV